MSQSKQGSLIEAIVNTFVGMMITFMFSPFIYWICNIPITIGQMGKATFLFTILSIMRQYFIRRWFNGKIYKRKSPHVQL